MAIVLRFVDKDGFIKEHFFDIVHVLDTTSAILKEEICIVRSRHNLSVQNIRSQGHEGAITPNGPNVIYKQAEKIGALLKAANLSVESYWPNLFAKLAEKKSIDDLIINVASVGAAAPVAVAAPSAGSDAAAPPPEEKKKEPKEDTDEDLGFSLFD
ncbi:60S acidic ribosomal protein P1-like [Camellia sinensis]|uniref:60S acidic ribosomal protein P1-like n=1 Tax=Camellia sinensis TaxID=4442 RepID=UPI00103689BB|nr:60S acidic ribosomal protein P1-like [Camellia sinensis]